MAKDDAGGPLLFELNNGRRIPSVGLGTWQADSGVVGDIIVAAVKALHGLFPIPCLFYSFPSEISGVFYRS